MASIRFTRDEMIRVLTRLDEITEQLDKAMAGASENLNALKTLTGNSTDVASAIEGYKEATEVSKADLRNHLSSLEAYLTEKIANYGEIDESSAQAIAEIKGILDNV